MADMRRLLPVLVGALALAACNVSRDIPVEGAVLRPGQSVQATNKFGFVRVTYLSPVKRRFEWDGQSRAVKMIVRPEPWLGELGLYNPADCFVVVFPLCRTPRLVVEEASHDFDSYGQIYAFLSQGSAAMDWVYTSDGLLVGFSHAPAREQINVDVRQLTIQGRKPEALRGARNGGIRLTPSTDVRR